MESPPGESCLFPIDYSEGTGEQEARPLDLTRSPWTTVRPWGTGSRPLSMFTTDGTSGLSLGNSELATAVHDTYPVTGHFHYVLSLQG